MQSKIVIAIVAMLMAASFVGIAFMGDDSAAETSPIAIDTEDTIPVGDTKEPVSNKILGNDLEFDGKTITGSVTKVTKGNEYIQTWFNGPTINVGGDKVPQYSHFLVFTITAGKTASNTDNYVTFMSEGKVKSCIASDLGGGKLTIVLGIDKDNAKKTFTYAITPGPQTSMEGLVTNSFDIDVQLDVITVEVRYTVGDLTYVQEIKSGTDYTLVALDALKAEAPVGKKFVGWTNGTNTYSVGTVVKLDNTSSKVQFTAVFEDLPEAVITFVDGTSTLKSINVSDLSEKTVPSVEKTGYTFDGWFMGDVKIDPLTYTFEESVTLVAQWTPINCYVTFVAGEFVKTVPVLYGDRVQAPALPDGFEKWNFDFSVVITDDLTITAVEKAPEKPTGLADPTIKMALVVVGLFVCVLLAVIILKREDIRAGMVRKLSKADDVVEDKKE